ncbi:MAG TPA: hypothetical protein VJ045_04275 [Hyphomicrobiaceae bacterium]|nr:hypothetical protein [Hyphomicrobiaceae bacterium]
MSAILLAGLEASATSQEVRAPLGFDAGDFHVTFAGILLVVSVLFAALLLTYVIRRWYLARIITINVGVSYRSDPEHVRDVLLRVAEECPLILRQPAPMVVFEDFASSSLDFSLRVAAGDITKRLLVATDLRMRIFKAFRAAGIELPFPQHDVHLRDLDAVRAVIARIAAEKAAQSGAGEQAEDHRPERPEMRRSRL